MSRPGADAETPPAVLVDGEPGACVAVDDRGFLYGDGVFETVAVARGAAPLWRYHRRRLREACRRLRLQEPPEREWRRDIARVAPDEAAVVRLVLTRGRGSGYAVPAEARPTRVVMRLPGAAPGAATTDLVVGLCETRLAPNPALAGLKHLCRLEQVLAATEAAARGWDEGLMLDAGGSVVEATRGNVLACRDGRWITPPLDECGVAGVYRAFLLDSTPLEVAPLDTAELPQLDALAVCNAVRGVRLIGRVAGVVRYRSRLGARRLEELCG